MNRLQLAGAYVAIMFLGLLLFAAAAVFAIDRTERTALDARLQTNARAAEQFVDVKRGRIALDRSDHEQIDEIVGPGSDVAVLDGRGTVLFSSVQRVPPALRRAYAKTQFLDAGKGDAKVRVFILPVMNRKAPAGSVVVWAGSDWIDETDRNLAIALGALALLIAGLALLAGHLVTRRALEDAFARQRRFTADASHELRAPLAVIRAEADLALRKEREPDAYRSVIQTIASEADNMEAIIGDLLSAARAESGKTVREPVEVCSLLARIAERLAPAAAAQDTAIRLDASGEATILADASALERALVAIVHNAVQYSPPGGAIKLSCRRFDRFVEVTVEDNGPGFSAQALEHALERFWREPGSQAGTGTGLGLAIARAIIQANGGTISLANTQDGASVRIRLPATARSG